MWHLRSDSEEHLAGALAHSSDSDGHIVPVAGWSLGGAVAAQVLVDAGHLVIGCNVRHLQVWVGAVGLRAPHVHCLQQMLAVDRADLPWGRDKKWHVFDCPCDSF